ncbi:class I SAM-dependent methyltransferase [Kineosporia babensis]|uniref:Class I SAM-dependent methyltransferase n=1 Tax=Kineosporia babensis TaxID=499548 RepID=A0A9X1ST29_9ACTN|nr:class I SAM-dependent methyltransferase [Kineosporia babensis]MCD5311367.1 class I SAM-dependent methyltransferase [Kineosporia babensis]
MGEIRDYVSWHDEYERSGSALAWRLSRVRHHIGLALDLAFDVADLALDAVDLALDAAAGRELTALSLCAGDGRDLIGVLSARPDADRVRATLVEIDPVLGGRARAAAAEHGLRLRVLQADAGDAALYQGLIPADLVLMVGIFGNISTEDLERTIRSAGAFCRPGARLIWSRGRDEDIHDLNDSVRGWFAAAGFREIAYEALERDERPALGVMEYAGEAVPLDTARRLFAFIR